MADCVPIPTQTLYATSTYSTISVSTTVLTSFQTTTDTLTFTSTTCLVSNTQLSGPACLSSAIVTSTSLTLCELTSLYFSSILFHRPIRSQQQKVGGGDAALRLLSALPVFCRRPVILPPTTNTNHVFRSGDPIPFDKL